MTEQLQQWQELREGKRTALEYFFRCYYTEMYQYAAALLPDEVSVQDQVQQFFLGLWEKHSQLPAKVKVKSYLFQSLRFAIIDELRRRQRSRIVLWENNDHRFEWRTAVLEQTDYAEDTQLQEALKSLSPTQQEIIFLRFFNRIPYPEIAEIMGMRYQSVRNAAHRGFKKMRTILKKDHPA
ncbi:MAG: sigma-70 family RNA polymerase sigma factor [Bacteroidota bacterium]